MPIAANIAVAVLPARPGALCSIPLYIDSRGLAAAFAASAGHLLRVVRKPRLTTLVFGNLYLSSRVAAALGPASAAMGEYAGAAWSHLAHS